MVNLSGIYGYCYTDKLQLGGGPSLTILDYGFGNSTNLGLTFFGRYYFTARNKLVPYASAQWYQYDIAPDDPVGFFDMTFMQGGARIQVFRERVHRLGCIGQSRIQPRRRRRVLYRRSRAVGDFLERRETPCAKELS